MGPSELGSALEYRSGLVGLAGTGDMKAVLQAEADGDEDARISRSRLYLHRLRGEIAAMTAALGGLDVLVFTGGVGERSAPIRARAADGLGFLGVGVDRARNQRPSSTQRSRPTAPWSGRSSSRRAKTSRSRGAFGQRLRSNSTSTASCSYALKRWSAPASTKTASPTFTGTLCTFDVERARAVEHDVDLVVLVRLLPVRLRRDEHVDAELDADGLVDDLVAAARGTELLDDGSDSECVHAVTVSEGVPRAHTWNPGWTASPVEGGWRHIARASRSSGASTSQRPAKAGLRLTRTSRAAAAPGAPRGRARRPRCSRRGARAPG